MALVTLEEASARYGVSQETLEAWEAQGLLVVRQRPISANLTAADSSPSRVERCVDADRLDDLVESLGWLQVSRESWDGEE